MEKIRLYRKKIDIIDHEILKLLAKRRKISLQIGKLKHKLLYNIRDNNRENEALKIRLQKAIKLKIPKKLVNDIFRQVFMDSRQIQAASDKK